MTIMTDNEVINEAREAAEYLQMQISEAEMQYERAFKLRRLMETLLKFTEIFKSFGFGLIELGILKICSKLAYFLASLNWNSTISQFLEKTGEFLRLLSNILPFKEPLLLGLSLYITTLVFMYLFRFIDQSMISPEEVSKRFEDQLEKARSLLRVLEQELNELYTEGGL